MGTFPKRCPLTHAQIVERYQGGEGLGLLSLRCRRPQDWVRDVLVAHNIPIRTAAETRALGIGGSKTLKPRRLPPLPGANPWGTP